MSDAIKHECGVAFIRLKKPLEYYIEKYGTPFYGLGRLSILMQKQNNRGQDGAGVAVIKLGVKPGLRYISRYRSVEPNPVQETFEKIDKRTRKALKGHKDKLENVAWLKENVPFTGELLLGHLRYGTHGSNSVEFCHPFLRQNNWRSRNLVMAGNFNMTNAEQLFNKLIELGQHPKDKGDTVTVLEKIGHFLDEENQYLFNKFKNDYDNQEISGVIEQSIDLQRVLKRSCKDFDGGYTMVGMTGYGAAFVARDPAGIRPAYYYSDDEVIVAASERPAIKAAFGALYRDIKEITPGHALIIDANGDFEEKEFIEEPLPKSSCSFERIYFSRGYDADIYKERKRLGKLVIPQVLEKINHDFENTVFSYIPNTAETAFMGMMEGLQEHLSSVRLKLFKEAQNDADFEKVNALQIRTEKVVIKDAKMRTFITDDNHRDSMVSQGYDTCSFTIREGIDSLVVIDDSIVRGTTLEKSILRTLDRLGPKKIVVVSSAPQIRYPDCYGIDMSRMKDFVAFRAAMSLLKERGMDSLPAKVYDDCVKYGLEFEPDTKNIVKEIYAPFSDEEISDRVAKIITPPGLKAKVEVVFQTVENLHRACPDHKGDWYFTGNYPTPGGNRVVNKAFVNYMEGKLERAY